MNNNKKLFDYIKRSPTPYHAVKTTADILENAGYKRLSESETWSLEDGGRYYVTRGGSSLIAFSLPRGSLDSFMMTAAHSDSPCFRIKENSEISGNGYVKLSCEMYGGLLRYTWLDRPLSVAGRAAVKTENGIEMRLFDFSEPCAVIPSVAIHMNRRANDGLTLDLAADMLPVYGTEGGGLSFKARIAEAVGADEGDILSIDTILYNPQYGVEWNGVISAPRIDDLQCAYASLEAFVTAKNEKACSVYCLFDNEEVGSLTKQGADSTFLYDTLRRMCISLSGNDYDFTRVLANSFLVSCDNGHAVHPNHPELSDRNHTVKLNGGVVIKYNANQKYTSDGITTGIFRLICNKAGAPCQVYANRADLPGGSTLGNISNAHVSLNTVDVGLAQLAMHSSYETAGAEDTDHMIRALKCFFESSLRLNADGSYTVE